MNSLLNYFLILIFALKSNTLWAQIEPPNYNFSLDKFELFMPGNSLENIEREYGKSEAMYKTNNFITYRFYVSHIRYKFPILVQVRDSVVTDFYANLPSYFLHDLFHQSLINRIGKQDQYINKNEHSVYQWKNANNFTHTYSGTCTITCFPIYYAVKSNDSSLGMNFKSILDQLHETTSSK